MVLTWGLTGAFAQVPATPQAPASTPDARPLTSQDLLEIAALREQGNTGEALARALAALQNVEAQPRGQAEVIETLSILIGRIHSERHAHVQAEPHYLRLLAIFEASSGTRHIDLVEPLRALTRLRRLQGQAQEAEALIERTRALWQTPSATVFGVKFDGTSHDLQNLAALRYDARQYAQAEALYLQALKLIEADGVDGQTRFGFPGNGILARQADCLDRLAIVSERMGKAGQAASFREQAAQARSRIRAEPLSRPPSWGQGVFVITP